MGPKSAGRSTLVGACLQGDAEPAMVERRGLRRVRDTGARTRGSDRAVKPATPHATPVWMTTFQLRWADHLGRRKPNHSVA